MGERGDFKVGKTLFVAHINIVESCSIGLYGFSVVTEFEFAAYLL